MKISAKERASAWRSVPIKLLLALLLSSLLALGISGFARPQQARAAASSLPGVAGARFTAAFLTSLAHPDALPPGVSTLNAPCTPSAQHPRPVILLHGTALNAYDDWKDLAALLHQEGYCLYALNYGAPAGTPIKGTGDIPASAQQLAGFVNQVLAVTGASKVDLVGHSQGGGPMPRWYLKFDGGASKVHALIGITPSNHGTTGDGLLTLAAQLHALGAIGAIAGPAFPEQYTGSSFNQTLDQGGDTVPGVSYTTIVTRFDEIVTPYTNGFLTAGSGASVTNITLQKLCPADTTEHIAADYDSVVLQLVSHTLAGNPTQPVTCN